jgi:hypothetical protein
VWSVAEVVSLPDWLVRLDRLQDAFTRSARVDLLPIVDRLRAVIAVAADGDEATLALLREATRELRARLLDATRPSGAVESQIDQHLALRASAAAVQSDAAPVPSSPALPLHLAVELAAAGHAEPPSRTVVPPPEETSPALWMRRSLADADDHELDAFAGLIRQSEAKRQESATGKRALDELGTLREPIPSATSGVAPTTAARVLMKGELQPGLVTDLLQLFAQNAETGRLVLEGKTTLASVFFREGRITDAECEEDGGEKAFFRAMLIRDGRFSYERGVETPTPRIFRSAQHLIMDTLRLIDEAS